MAMHRFVVNTRSLYRRRTGVERYTAEVMKRLDKLARFIAPASLRLPGTGHLWEQMILPLELKPGELLWSPANTGPVAVTRQVLTLHDISVLENPLWFHPTFAAWYRYALPRLVRRVRRVLTVSEYSRQRIVSFFHLPMDHVVAIPGGVDLDHFRPATEQSIEQIRRRYRLPAEYLLFVGTIEPRKNLVRLIEAWRRIKGEFPQLALVIAGSAAPNFRPVDPLTAWPGLEAGEDIRLRFLGYVPEAELPALYSGAKLFILPSLCEGFGLPILEAMACGTPVISSRAGALAETVGDAGWLVDPMDPNSLAHAMAELLRNRDCWMAYRQRGLEHVSQFSWENTAERVFQELDSASQEEDVL